MPESYSEEAPSGPAEAGGETLDKSDCETEAVGVTVRGVQAGSLG